MALKINTLHGTLNRTWRAAGLGGIENFLVHYTGGTGSAKNNCLYFRAADRKASADLFIDKDGSIWEYNNVLDGYYTWHCGDGGGRYGITNSNSMSVEVVSNGEAFTAAQIASLKALYAHYCSVLGRKLVVARHYDASRKSCPAAYVEASKWSALKSQIEGGKAAGTGTATKPAKPSGETAASKPANKTKEEKVYKFATIKSGSKGNAVKLFQAAYNTRFGGKLSVDGISGANTVKAIKDVQKRGKIAQDGICGQNTWQKTFLE